MTKQRSFDTYIYRTLKKAQPECRITKTASNAVDSVIRVATEQLVNRGLHLIRGGTKKTISSLEIRNAVRLVLPDQLVGETLANADLAVKTFKSSDAPDQGKPISREVRAGLIFSVSLTEKYIRVFGKKMYNVGAMAPVFLAAVLQHLCTRMITLGSAEATRQKRATIKPRDLFIASQNDESLGALFSLFNVVFLQTGVVPRIEESLLQTGKKKRLAPLADGKKRNHRFRPGTVALRDIRRFQKSGELLMQHAPFNRAVRTITCSLNKNVRFTADVLLNLQAVVENRFLVLLQTTNKIAIHSMRETVYDRDVQLAWDLIATNTTRDVDLVVDVYYPAAALRKLSRRAGIKRFSDSSLVTSSAFITQLLTSYLHDMIICAEHHGVSTLNEKLFVEALDMRGLHPALTPAKRKSTKKGTSMASTTESAMESVAESVMESGDEESSESEDDE